MKNILKVIPLHTNEAKTIKYALEGKREAQKTLYNRYAPKMLSVCRYYIKDLHFAEDVMVTAFFKAFTNLESFRGDGSFEGWLRRIMVRESISFLRSKKEMDYLEDGFASLTSDEMDENLEDVDIETLQLLIDELPEGYKTVLILYAVEGHSHKEIAEMLSIAESTSKSQLFKARRLLQQQLLALKNKEHGRAKI